MGYYRAGFEVEGVDIKPQPHYPFKFYQADALTFPLEGYDAYHASPPCQLWSKSAKQWRKQGKVYLDYITPIRMRFILLHTLYIIENVPEAPLIQPTILDGGTFGMYINRRRAFETNFHVPFVLTCLLKNPLKMGRPPINSDDVIQPVGHFSGVAQAGRIMGIDWMNQGELSQAIPPAYTEYLGKYLLQASSHI